MAGASTITVKTPVRVDIAGGTLDVYPIYNVIGSSLTVNFAINIFSRVKLKRREEEGIQINFGKGEKREFLNTHSLENKGRLSVIKHVFEYFPPFSNFALAFDSEAPIGSGLGASSSLIVALLTAIGLYSDNLIPVKNLFLVASEIESSLIKMMTGKQDYVPAIFGGLNVIKFSPGKTQMVNIKREKSECRFLEEYGVLAYTGISHVSANENWTLVKKLLDGGRKGQDQFIELLSLAEDASAAIAAKDPVRLGDVIEREWKARKSLSPNVTVDVFEKFMNKREVKKVIRSARLCGAGGGGTMFGILRSPDHRKRAAELARKAGFLPIPFSISKGLEVRVGGKRVELL